jgi:hypoxia up-regulated 1
MQQYNGFSFVVQVSSVNRIPKPKPKIEKKPANEVPASNGKIPSPESGSNESEPTENSQESKASEEDQSASKSENSEPESHDEL